MAKPLIASENSAFSNAGLMYLFATEGEHYDERREVLVVNPEGVIIGAMTRFDMLRTYGDGRYNTPLRELGSYMKKPVILSIDDTNKFDKVMNALKKGRTVFVANSKYKGQDTITYSMIDSEVTDMEGIEMLTPLLPNALKSRQ